VTLVRNTLKAMADGIVDRGGTICGGILTDLQQMKEDALALWNLIPPGGILAGVRFSAFDLEVAQDVFCLAAGLGVEEIHVAHDQTWWVVKPGNAEQ